jgi:iron complex transport system ATP-binding protein
MVKGHKISYSHKKYNILKGVDVEVEYGDVLIIVGPNGAGKSTLLNILSNEISGTAEGVFFKQRPFKDWKNDELSRNKAKFSQHYSNDIPLPAKDVVLMGRYPYFESVPKAEDYESVEEAMQATDVWDLRERDYNTLSGGEKQRIHLARTMAQLKNDIAHKLVLLDEPLNNLDVKHQYRVLEMLKDFAKKGNTVVVVLHDLNLAAKFATKVLLMQKGKVAAQGTPEEVFTSEIITNTYGFPCTVLPNPINKEPIILFGNDDY